MEMKMAVKLLKPYRHYSAGECADFGEVINQRLIDAKSAELHEVPDAKPADKQAGKQAGKPGAKSDASGGGEGGQTKTDGDAGGQAGENPPAGQ
ncbi:MAG TPA: hypothetical protein VJ572_01795 [Azonexus sp.]|nr:hypothetical protein [Azonexus sp.]